MKNTIKVAPVLVALSAAQIDMLKFGAQTAGAGVYDTEFINTPNAPLFGVTTHKYEYKYKIGITDATWTSDVTSGASANVCIWNYGEVAAKEKTCWKAEITDPEGAKTIKVGIHIRETIANTPTWTDTPAKSVYDQMTDLYAGPCEITWTLNAGSWSSASTGTCTESGGEFTADATDPVVSATGFLVNLTFTWLLAPEISDADYLAGNNLIYNSNTFLHTGTSFYDGTTRTFSSAGVTAGQETNAGGSSASDGGSGASDGGGDSSSSPDAASTLGAIAAAITLLAAF